MAMSVPAVGQPAPDFELESGDGKKIRLSDFRGKKVVLYFYPRDMTPGCTEQACAFRDAWEEFGRLNAVVLGISADPAESHAKFAAKYELPFPLLSDPDHKVCELYGVWKEKKMYGKTFMGIERSTFLIGEDGRLLRQWRGVQVKGHIGEVLTAVAEASGAGD